MPIKYAAQNYVFSLLFRKLGLTNSERGDILCKQLVRANYFSVLHKSAGSSRPEHDPIIIFLMVIK